MFTVADMSSIDYDLRKIKGFAFDVDGVLSPSTIPMSSEGEPLRMVNIKDGYALQLAIKLGYKIAIITGGRTEAVRHRYEALGITDIFMGAAHKLPVFEHWMIDNNLGADEVLFMGDDIPDLKAIEAAGLGCAPRDAAWEIKDAATYVSPIEGGYGCARDVIEQTIKAQGKWLTDEKAFGW